MTKSSKKDPLSNDHKSFFFYKETVHLSCFGRNTHLFLKKCEILEEITSDFCTVRLSDKNITDLTPFRNAMFLDLQFCPKLKDFSSLIGGKCQSVLLRNLPPTIDLSSLDGIQKLTFYNCHLYNRLLQQIRNVKTLNFKFCYFPPSEINELSNFNAEKIYSCYNYIKRITNCPNLKVLNVENVSRLELIENLPKLEKIKLNGCGSQTFTVILKDLLKPQLKKDIRDTYYMFQRN